MAVEDDSLDFGFLRTAFEAISVPFELFNWPSVEGATDEIVRTGCSLVIVDINLSDGSGIDLVRQIRAHEKLRKIPVIAFSSSVSEQDVSDCYIAGVNAYMEKPLSIDTYRKFARAFSMFWLETAVLPG